MLGLRKYIILAVLLVLVGWVLYSNLNLGKTSPSTLTGAQTSLGQETITGSTNANSGLNKGNVAPDFTLQTSDGKTVKLSDFRGKKVILNFWATWCPPCRAEIPDMEKFYEANKDKNVVILGVNLTQAEKTPESVPQFMKDNKMTYPILMDTKGLVGDQYQISAIPTSFILDTQGVIHEVITGPMTYQSMGNMMKNLP